ncbi:MAG: GNAT family N-acetyltransferase, partial [Cyanobacteria bacterium]|nr:GNAT family N-acetyltransferase [Cyanobacteriota bacterium]
IWLGNLLGCSAYHVPADTEPLLLDQLPSGPAFVDAKVGVNQLQRVHHLEQLGFRLVDTNLQLSVEQISPGISHFCGPHPQSLSQGRRGTLNLTLLLPFWEKGLGDEGQSCQIEIDPISSLSEETLKACRWATPEDEAEVTAIAAQSFTVSRFHLDPQIPNAIANQIKAAWARNFFIGQRGDWMVVAVVQGKVAGFLQLLQSQANALILDLLAVDPNYRGQGLGRSMITYAAHHCLQSLRKIQVGTQVANIPALNLYKSLGFQVEQASYVLHLHVGVSQ